MPSDWVPLLIQVPLVGIFAWFVIYTQKEWQRSIEKLGERIDNLASKIDQLNGAEVVASKLAEAFWGRGNAAR